MQEAEQFKNIPDLDFTHLVFPDLRIRLEQNLESVKAIPEVENLLRSVNGLMKNSDLSVNEVGELKKIRQRAYDRKRFLKSPHVFEKTDSDNRISTDIKIPNLISIRSDKPQTSEQKLAKTRAVKSSSEISGPIRKNFWQGMWKGITDLDGEKFIKRVPIFLILLATNIGVTYLVWLQSLELYQSNGFHSPQLAAVGALVMVVGFSIFHAISKSWISTLLCFYICSYEVYFMISGTIQDEVHKITTEQLQSERMVFLKENVARTDQQYLELKNRYENAKSNVYQNHWFKNKFLSPAWDQKKIAVDELENYQISSRSINYLKNNFLLKILYRIGLVFLTMVFSACLINFFKKNYSQYSVV